MCRELQKEPAGAEDETVMGAYFGHSVEPLEVVLDPAPSPGSPGSPTPGWCLERCCAHCHSCGGCGGCGGGEEEEAGAAAAGPWVIAAWEPWQSSV